MITEQELDRRLRSLATAVDWPADQDVTAGVRGALSATPRVRPALVWWRRQPALAALVLVLLAFSAVLIATPSTRSAVARLLGFPGVAVERTTEPAPELSGIDMGRAVTVAQAEELAGHDVKTLPLPLQQATFDEATGAVHLLYRLDDERPVLVTQLRGADHPAFLKQSGQVAPAEVEGEFALWASGPDHAFLRVAGRRDEARLSSNALLWAAGDITYRLEIDGSLSEAEELAESLE